MSDPHLDDVPAVVDLRLFSADECRAFEEARAVLQYLARSHASGDAGLGRLMRTLTESEESPALLNDEVHRAELLLRKAQARYRALVEQIPAVTFLAPLDGTTSELYVSPQIEALLGFSAREWLGNPVLRYTQLHPEAKER